MPLEAMRSGAPRLDHYAAAQAARRRTTCVLEAVKTSVLCAQSSEKWRNSAPGRRQVRLGDKGTRWAHVEAGVWSRGVGSVCEAKMGMAGRNRRNMALK